MARADWRWSVIASAIAVILYAFSFNPIGVGEALDLPGFSGEAFSQ